MVPHITRRRFLGLSAVGVVGGGGYGVYREVQRVRETVARLSSM
jgi:hypothetical protein